MSLTRAALGQKVDIKMYQTETIKFKTTSLRYPRGVINLVAGFMSLELAMGTKVET